MRKFCLAILFGAVIAGSPAHAARCGGDFNSFVASMSAEAQAAGISPAVISQALSGVTQDPAVLNFDRRQRGTFNKTFEQYVSTRVGPGRINIGRQMLQRHAALLARIEKRFGVPPEIIVAIWGLESDYGKGDIGKMPVVRTLATMAHDCRAPNCSRASCWRREDRSAAICRLRDMIGAFARRNRPDAILSSHIKYGVDFDGNGHIDPRHSIPMCRLHRQPAHVSGFRNGAPYGEGHRELRGDARVSQATIYRKTIAYFADQLVGR
jgi:membrane-bound lytic murein transglycosylase B